MCGGVDTGFDTEAKASKHRAPDIGGCEWEYFPLTIEDRRTILEMAFDSHMFVFLDSQEPEHVREFHSMCMTYRHDYGILGPEDKAETQIMVAPLFNHHVLPLLKEKK